MGYPLDSRTARLPPMSIPTRGPPRAQKVAAVPPKHLIPFDPEELTRRLYLVQAEQKAYADRKRRVRVEAERQAKVATIGESQAQKKVDRTRPTSHPNSDRSHHSRGNNPDVRKSQDKIRTKHDSSPQQHSHSHRRTGSVASTSSGHKPNEEAASSYHHKPQVAASQFARTTTVENADDAHIHSLSKKAMKFHLDGPNANHDLRPLYDIGPRDAARNLRRAQSQREKQYERNQFQHPSNMDSAIEIDEQRLRLAQRHTFETTLGKDDNGQDAEYDLKRSSMGAKLFAPVLNELPPTALHLDRVDSRDNGGTCGLMAERENRVDWTQSDECPKSPEHAAPSLLRKVDSKWNLKGRFAKSRKSSEPRHLTSPAEESASEDLPMSPKSPKHGFFSRFKR